MRRLLTIILFLALITALPAAALADDIFTVIPGGVSYQHTLNVAKSGARFSSISAALNSISDAASDNRYLVSIGPGTYEETVQLIPWVDVTGAGRGATIISSAGGAADTSATITGADNCTLGHLTVHSTGSGDYCQGILNDNASPLLQHLVVEVEDGGSAHAYGIRNDQSASPRISDVHISVKTSGNPSVAIGIMNEDGSSPDISDTKIESLITSGANCNCMGMYNNDTCAPVLHNVSINIDGGAYSLATDGIWSRVNSPVRIYDTRISVNAATGYVSGVYNSSSDAQVIDTTIEVTGSGDSTNHGVRNQSADQAVLRNMNIQVMGATSDSHYGVLNHGCSPLISRLSVYVSGAAGENVAAYNDDASPEYEHCSLIADTSSGTAVGVANKGTARPSISLCQVRGGHIGLRNRDGDPNVNPLTVLHSRLLGSTAALVNNVNFALNVVSCILDGPRTISGGTVNCADCYNNSGGAATCP